VTKIKNKLNIDAVITPGGTGQFDVIVGGQVIVKRGGNWITRKFGVGYPDLDDVVERIRSFSGNDKNR
jgi:hypothetical protein